MNEKNNGDASERFSYYIKVRAKKIAVALTAIAIGLSVWVCMFAKPYYQATAQLYMVPSTDVMVDLSDIEIGSYLSNDYLKLLQMWEVSQRVIDHLGLSYDVEEMMDRLDVSTSGRSKILKISFLSETAEEAALAANEYAEVVRQYMSEIMNMPSPSVISKALIPDAPEKPEKAEIIFFGTTISALLILWGLFLTFLCSRSQVQGLHKKGKQKILQNDEHCQ